MKEWSFHEIVLAKGIFKSTAQAIKFYRHNFLDSFISKLSSFNNVKVPNSGI